MARGIEVQGAVSAAPWVAPIDSPYRCPHDGKKMVMELATNALGEERHIHECWDCGHRRY